MRPLKVSSVQRGCVHDGRGVRTTVFLKGCALRCPWCCNPEMMSDGDEVFIDEGRCLRNRNIAARFCAPCERRGGGRPVAECPLRTGEPVARYYSAEELYGMLAKDAALFSRTGGGVTFSGGEPLLQSEALLPLLRKLKRGGIDIVFETALAVPAESVANVLPFADGFLVDIKLQPQMKLHDAAYIGRMKSHYSLLEGRRLASRMVFVNDMAGHREKIVSVLKYLGISQLELLLCHNLGAKKYEKLGLPYADYSADRGLMAEFSACLSAEGIRVNELYV